MKEMKYACFCFFRIRIIENDIHSIEKYKGCFSINCLILGLHKERRVHRYPNAIAKYHRGLLEISVWFQVAIDSHAQWHEFFWFCEFTLLLLRRGDNSQLFSLLLRYEGCLYNVMDDKEIEINSQEPTLYRGSERLTCPNRNLYKMQKYGNLNFVLIVAKCVLKSQKEPPKSF